MLKRLLLCAALALLPSLSLAQPTQSGIAPSAAGKSLAVSNVSSCVAMTQQNNSAVIWNVGSVAAYYNVNGATATTGNPQLPAGGVITVSIQVGASLCAITASSTTTLQITQGFGQPSVALGGSTSIAGTVAVTQSTSPWVVSSDPCQGTSKSSVPISQTASTVLVSASASNRIYVCSLTLIAGAAEIVNLIQGTGSTCGTSTDAIIGSTTVGNGLSFAANGGITLGSGLGTVARGPNTNEDVCLSQSTTSRVSGVMTYVLAP